MSASYEVRGAVAVITLNNPPVNGLGYETRKAVAEGIEKAEDELHSGAPLSDSSLWHW